VIATAQAGRVTLSWDDALDVAGNHWRAAKALADKFGWLDFGAVMHGGALPSGGYCFVITS
jgi:hypothetical protein